eukprot:10623960-Ditylum_brightwellii.AAC.2
MEMHKTIAKKIAHDQNNHDKAMKAKGKARHQSKHTKLDVHHRKYHARKQKKKFSKKYTQPTHLIMEEQRLRQVYFVKVAKRHPKKHSLNAKEFKDANVFVKDK